MTGASPKHVYGVHIIYRYIYLLNCCLLGSTRQLYELDFWQRLRFAQICSPDDMFMSCPGEDSRQGCVGSGENDPFVDLINSLYVYMFEI